VFEVFVTPTPDPDLGQLPSLDEPITYEDMVLLTPEVEAEVKAAGVEEDDPDAPPARSTRRRRRRASADADVEGEPTPDDLEAIADEDAAAEEASEAGLAEVGEPPTPEEQVALEQHDLDIMNAMRKRVADTVEDPETAAKLMPYYGVRCKRPCFHDEYLPTFNRPNVHLVDTDGKGVDLINENGIVVDGVEFCGLNEEANFYSPKELRFPVTPKFALTEGGATAVLLSSGWPTPRIGHWDVLTRARAIENQAWLIACNEVGRQPGVVLGGHSTVVNPMGDVVALAGEEPEVVYVDVDPGEAQRWRAQFPVLEDIRIG